MKKAIILAAKYKNMTKGELHAFIDFTKAKDMEITSMLYYPFISSLENPDDLVESLRNEDKDVTYIVNDTLLIDINAYTDGRFFEALRQNDIHVIHSRYQDDLIDIWNSLSEEAKQSLKEGVTYALEKSMENNTLIITCDKEQEEAKKVINRLDEDGHSQIVGVLQLRYYVPEVKNVIEQLIENSKVNKIVVVDQKIKESELGRDLEELSQKYDLVFNDEEYNLSGQQEEMILNQQN